MRDSAQQISQVSGDSRTLSYAGQLASRYQSLASAVKVCYFHTLFISF